MNREAFVDNNDSVEGDIVNFLKTLSFKRRSEIEEANESEYQLSVNNSIERIFLAINNRDLPSLIDELNSSSFIFGKKPENFRSRLHQIDLTNSKAFWVILEARLEREKVGLVFDLNGEPYIKPSFYDH